MNLSLNSFQISDSKPVEYRCELHLANSLDQVAIPCRPQKTFTLYVFDVPDDLPEEDIRHSLYKFNSVVEVVRIVVFYKNQGSEQNPSGMLPFLT